MVTKSTTRKKVPAKGKKSIPQAPQSHIMLLTIVFSILSLVFLGMAYWRYVP